MNRKDLQVLARTRLKDAKALHAVHLYPGAYYLSGYVVECALKASIAKNTHRSEFPDKKLATQAFTHDLNELVKTAGLLTVRDRAFQTDPDLEINWTTVKDWSPESRYRLATKTEATDILGAIVDVNSGVLKWLKQHW